MLGNGRGTSGFLGQRGERESGRHFLWFLYCVLLVVMVKV